jgi:hypothetical protein
MPVKDTFSYNARWDSVGLDCSTCLYFIGPDHWPDKERTIKCGKHQVSLAIELGKNLFKEFEWFCKEYDDNGGFEPAVKHFKEIKDKLEYGIIYRLYGKDVFLIETKISELEEAI